jgi:predicted DNA-binding transcriptional regulator AlpA
MAKMPTAQTISEVDAARYIGMSVSWLRQSRANGNSDAPPFLKIGRSVRYLVSDLDEWLLGCRQFCGSQN